MGTTQLSTEQRAPLSWLAHRGRGKYYITSFRSERDDGPFRRWLLWKGCSQLVVGHSGVVAAAAVWCAQMFKSRLWEFGSFRFNMTDHNRCWRSLTGTRVVGFPERALANQQQMDESSEETTNFRTINFAIVWLSYYRNVVSTGWMPGIPLQCEMRLRSGIHVGGFYPTEHEKETFFFRKNNKFFGCNHMRAKTLVLVIFRTKKSLKRRKRTIMMIALVLEKGWKSVQRWITNTRG